jgi:hypothetical protein
MLRIVMTDRTDATSNTSVTYTGERRSFARSGLNSRPMAIILPDEPDARLDVFGRNLSACGVMFVCPRVLALDCPIEVHMPVGPEGRLEIVRGKVIRCTPLDGSCCEVAVQFDTSLDVASFTPVWELPA